MGVRVRTNVRRRKQRSLEARHAPTWTSCSTWKTRTLRAQVVARLPTPASRSAPHHRPHHSNRHPVPWKIRTFGTTKLAPLSGKASSGHAPPCPRPSNSNRKSKSRFPRAATSHAVRCRQQCAVSEPQPRPWRSPRCDLPQLHHRRFAIRHLLPRRRRHKVRRAAGVRKCLPRHPHRLLRRKRAKASPRYPTLDG